MDEEHLKELTDDDFIQGDVEHGSSWAPRKAFDAKWANVSHYYRLLGQRKLIPVMLVRNEPFFMVWEYLCMAMRKTKSANTSKHPKARLEITQCDPKVNVDNICAKFDRKLVISRDSVIDSIRCSRFNSIFWVSSSYILVVPKDSSKHLVVPVISLKSIRPVKCLLLYTAAKICRCNYLYDTVVLKLPKSALSSGLSNKDSVMSHFRKKKKKSFCTIIKNLFIIILR